MITRLNHVLPCHPLTAARADSVAYLNPQLLQFAHLEAVNKVKDFQF